MRKFVLVPGFGYSYHPNVFLIMFKLILYVVVGYCIALWCDGGGWRGFKPPYLSRSFSLTFGMERMILEGVG